MRFLVDECIGPVVASWLLQQGHEVFSVYDEARGLEDDAVLQKALDEDWILVTSDRHFGAAVYQEGRRHRGVVLLRLNDERAQNKIHVLKRLLARHAEQLPNRFVVVTDKQVRFAAPTE